MSIEIPTMNNGRIDRRENNSGRLTLQAPREDQSFMEEIHEFFSIVFGKRFVKVLLASFALIISFTVPAMAGAPTEAFGISGGVLGSLSAFFVVISYIRNPSERGPPLALLFWRAFCDLGVAVRFVITPLFNKYVCGEYICSIRGNDALQSRCSFSSFLLEFFEICSEMWFFCIALDLLLSSTNPFSSFNQRLKTYHLFVWLVGFAFAVTTISAQNVAGFWYITVKVDTAAICWIQSHKTTQETWKPWILFYVPIIVIYIFAAGVVGYAYNRLRKGISNTVLHRMRILVMNTINIVVCLLYWLVLGAIYACVFVIPDELGAKWLYRLLVFLLSAKGFSAIIVWILVNGLNIGDATVVERVDLNTALRTEIMLHATKGIRVCTRLGQKLVKENKFVGRKRILFEMNEKSENQNNLNFSFWFFICLMFGRPQQVEQVRALADESKRKSLKEAAAGNKTKSKFSPSYPPSPPLSPSNYVSSPMRDGDYMTDDHMGNLESGRSPNISPLSSANTTPNKTPNKVVPVNDPRMTETRLSEFGLDFVLDEDDEDNYHIDIAEKAPTFNIFRGIYNFLTNFSDSSIVDFTEFEPYYFAQVRESAGISNLVYTTSFKNVLKERLTQGGASGAFFFFSDHEQFIAKSCTEEEMATLRKNAPAYAKYLILNKESYISKIYGAYRLRIYGVSLNFFVMMNIFLNDEGLAMNEKYDIKGSWVARNASPAIEGQEATCTHCGAKFIYRKLKKKRADRLTQTLSPFNRSGRSSTHTTGSPKKGMLSMFSRDGDTTPASTAASDATDIGSSIDIDRCPWTVHKNHEPNPILKDNDLKYKIMLPDNIAQKLRAQLRKDADFLRSVGIMDYSLLVGVHKSPFDLKTEEDIVSEAANRGRTGTSGTDISSVSNRQEEMLRASLARRGSSGVNEDYDSTIFASKKLEANKVVGPDVYLMGIIDFQQQWTLNKKLERFIKIHFKGEDPEGLSAIEPTKYYHRFVRKIDDILEFEDSRSGHNERESEESFDI